MTAGGRLSVAWVPGLAALAALAVFVTLGNWQLRRADAKAALVTAYEARRADAPMSVSPDWTELTPAAVREIGFAPILANGRFLPGRQFLLDNRTHAGVAGYHVLTPLALEGQRAVVLVNRGWVPVGPRRDRLPPVGVAASSRTVRGVAAPTGNDPPLLGESGYDARGWPRVVQRIEMDRIARALEMAVLPLVMRMAAGEPDGFVREWSPRYAVPPARHRAYAFQWFSLAATVVVVFVVLTLRGRRGG